MERAVLDQNPETVWQGLVTNEDSALVDVRTRSEWAFVGTADLSETGRPLVLVEWLEFPDMQRNQTFVEQVENRFDGNIPAILYFICRSGTRSKGAAAQFGQAMAAKGRSVQCINVAEGFEGDLNHDGHRGTVNGWKVKQLPWRQS